MKTHFLTLVAACLLFSITAPSTEALDVEVFVTNEEGHFVNSGIISSKKSIVILDAQLSPAYGRILAKRVKALKKEVKAIFISHGHLDHYMGVEELVKAFPKAQLLATQQTIDKMKLESGLLFKNEMRPYPYNPGFMTKSILPKAYSKDTYNLDGEEIRLIHVEHADTEYVTCFDIPSKGTLYRPYNAKYKRDLRWIPSNGTYWGSDVVIHGIHVLMTELESASNRASWMKNAKAAKSFVLANNRTIVPGHMNNLVPWTTESILDYMIKYLETFEKALKKKTGGEFWDRVMTDFTDVGSLFLLDWSRDQFYTSKRKTPLP
ncbi:Hydroxyacylglutathione hydrolase [Linnemannia zychae]|nr:Hydroxyacylglutathione hydrolase [Linnemannia zychae]